MKKEDIIRKLTSRKFWLAVAAFVTELIVVFRGNAEQAETVSAIIMAGATVIAYIVGEGLIDAGNVPAGGNTSSAPVLVEDARSHRLAEARSPRGSDMPPACHSLPRGRFATHEGKANTEGLRCE